MVKPKTRPRATIIGSGIVGVCCACYLQREGFDVEIVDPLDPGLGCSFGNAGGICPGSCVPIALPGMLRKVPKWLLDVDGPLHIRLAHLPHVLPWLVKFLAAGRPANVQRIADHMRALHSLTFDCYEPLLKAAGCQDLIEHRGQLFVYENAQELEGDSFALSLRRQRDVRIELLNADELHRLEPDLAPFFKHAVLLPEQGQCKNPHRLVTALAELVMRNGGKFIRATVMDLEMGPDGPTAIVTDQGLRPVQTLIVAAGAWSGKFCQALGDRVPLESERGYHVTVNEANINSHVQTIWSKRNMVASPMEDGLRFAGTVEFAGLVAPPDMRRADVLLRQGRRMYPGLNDHTVTKWMGHRPGLPDSLPVISRSKRYANVLYAFGHGHTGMIAGSVTGRLIAQLAAGRPPTIDLKPFSINRFSR